MCHGVSCGWSSVCAILLTSDETPLESGKITMDEASWIASLLCVGGLPGNVFCGIVTNKYGRKKPLIFIAIPTIVSKANGACNREMVKMQFNCF